MTKAERIFKSTYKEWIVKETSKTNQRCFELENRIDVLEREIEILKLKLQDKDIL